MLIVGRAAKPTCRASGEVRVDITGKFNVAYCSDACRKKASRGAMEQQTESRWIVECLRRMRFVAKIWPVYATPRRSSLP